jgi:hypothetical protein
VSAELHATLRHALYVIGGIVALMLVLRHFAPPPAPIHAPVAVFTPSPIEREAQALINVDALLAQRAAPAALAPAITVLKDTGAVGGLTDAQIAQILGALKPKTVEKVAVATALKAPTPAPTPVDPVMQQIYSADYAATTKALNETTIKTDVTISRQEVPPSRVGSFVSAGGSGLSLGLIRHGQYELDVAGVLRGAHIAPAASLQYLIPHTSLGLGPAVIYDHGAHPGIAATIHF